MYERAFLKNIVHYDAKNDFLSTIRHEALYAAYILTHDSSYNGIRFSIKDLQDLKEELSLFNNLNCGVTVNGKTYSYGICLFNKWCGFSDVKLEMPITKKEIQGVSAAIFENFGDDSGEFYDQLYELEKKLMFFITVTNHIPTLSLVEMISLVDNDTHNLIRKLPDGNAYVSYHINNALTDRCLDNFPQDLNLYKLFKSGSRFSKTQLARSCVNIGLLADENNIVHQDPIRTSLIEGLTPEEFFASAPIKPDAVKIKINSVDP